MERIEDTARAILAAALLGWVSVSLMACDGGGSDSDTNVDRDGLAVIEVAGMWSDNFGGMTTITASMWGNQSIASFDNAENWAVTQNPADAEYGPNTFNKVVWTEAAEDGVWYQCSVAFGLETAEEAMAAEDTSDATDPLTSGCGDFGWTQMSPG